MNDQANDESDLLVRYLNAQRGHILGILEDLPDEALHRPVLPSGWTCAGLVQHLALDVERFWFAVVTAGEAEASPDLPGNAWEVPLHVPGQSVLDLYRRQIARSDAIIAATPLDTPPTWWPEERWPGRRHQNLRHTMLHVIAETACHAGHLDAVRELLDGRTWLIVD